MNPIFSKHPYISIFSAWTLMIVILGGCASTVEDYNTAQNKLNNVYAQQNEKVQAYVEGTGESLALTADPTPNISLAIDFNKAAASLVGSPQVKDKFDVAALLNTNKSVSSPAWDKLNKDTSANAALVVDRDNLQKQVQDLQSQVAKLAKEKEDENNKHILGNIFGWATGIFGLAGGIAFLVLCPTIAIPLLIGILKAIFENLPAIIAWVYTAIKTVIGGLYTVGSDLYSHIFTTTITKPKNS